MSKFSPKFLLQLASVGFSCFSSFMVLSLITTNGKAMIDKESLEVKFYWFQLFSIGVICKEK